MLGFYATVSVFPVGEKALNLSLFCPFPFPYPSQVIHTWIPHAGVGSVFPHEQNEPMKDFNAKQFTWIENNSHLLTEHLAWIDVSFLRHTFKQFIRICTFQIFKYMPKVLFDMILCFTDFRDIPAVASTCRLWRIQMSPDVFRGCGLRLEDFTRSDVHLHLSKMAGYLRVLNCFPLDFALVFFSFFCCFYAPLCIRIVMLGATFKSIEGGLSHQPQSGC